MTAHDRPVIAAVDGSSRANARRTDGRPEKYPQADVVREPVGGPASRTPVTAPATAVLTVVGRHRGGGSPGGPGCSRSRRRR
ncbi:hypothetical protein GCM10010518_06180 [Kitasatospora cinereorecta]